MLHIIAQTYPDNPNTIVKKKYYNFIVNMPFFIPHAQCANQFEQLLIHYPVSSYLYNKRALVKWMHFIHNKINDQTYSKKITMEEHLQEFVKKYKENDASADENSMQLTYFIKPIKLIVILSALGTLVYNF
jgi:c-di-AMP phosphodiesterase-like protein